MRKIRFGYNNDKSLNDTFKGLERYNGDYIDVINYNGMDMLVTKIVDSHNNIDGNIDVREIAQNFYADGRYETYCSHNKPVICRKIEGFLNLPQNKQKLSIGISVSDILKSANVITTKSKIYPVYSENEESFGKVVSIRPELFEELKQYITKNNMSAFKMSKEIERLRSILAKTNQGIINKKYL